MFDLGIPELIMILFVSLIAFGPGRLPEVGAKLGKAIRDFRSATQNISDEINAVTNLEAEDVATTNRILAEQAQTSEPAAIQETPLPAALATTPEDASLAAPALAPEAGATPPVAEAVSDATAVTAEAAPIERVGDEIVPPPANAVLAADVGGEPPLPPELAEALAAGEQEVGEPAAFPIENIQRQPVTVVRRTIAESAQQNSGETPSAVSTERPA